MRTFMKVVFNTFALLLYCRRGRRGLLLFSCSGGVVQPTLRLVNPVLASGQARPTAVHEAKLPGGASGVLTRRGKGRARRLRAGG